MKTTLQLLSLRKKLENHIGWMMITLCSTTAIATAGIVYTTINKMIISERDKVIADQKLELVENKTRMEALTSELHSLGKNGDSTEIELLATKKQLESVNRELIRNNINIAVLNSEKTSLNAKLQVALSNSNILNEVHAIEKKRDLEERVLVQTQNQINTLHPYEPQIDISSKKIVSFQENLKILYAKLNCALVK